MSENYDIVIVGASFAGLSCARAALQHGMRVAILERRADCGHGIRTTGILVKDVFDHYTIAPKFLRKINSVRLYAPSMCYMDLHHPDYFFCTTNTPALMRHMAAEVAALGGDLKFDYAFKSAQLCDDGVTIPDLNITAKYLIGADGARSAVAEHFKLPQPQKFLLGTESEYSTDLIDTDRFHCFLDQNLAHGYLGWVAPGFGITQIGLAMRTPGKPDMKRFMDKIRPVFDCGNLPVLGNRGGLIPISPPLRHFSDGRVILIGDSMSLVSPVTAGGIDYALRYGTLLGGFIADAIMDKTGDPARRLAPLLPKFRQKHLLRNIFDVTPNWVLDAAIPSWAFRYFADRVFFKPKMPAV